MQRMRGQLIPRKNGCCLISLAPAFDPNRMEGSLFNNALINCLPERLTWKIKIGQYYSRSFKINNDMDKPTCIYASILVIKERDLSSNLLQSSLT
jgi:hypothetical protein